MAEVGHTAQLVVDNMDNTTDKHFGGWPERLYIVNKGKIAFKGMPGPNGYLLEPVQEWIENYLK